MKRLVKAKSPNCQVSVLKWGTIIGAMSLAMIWFLPAATAQDSAHDVRRWTTFTSKAGWRIKHPESWKVGSCRQCPDPTAADVLVTFRDSVTSESILIESLIDKPVNQSVNEWLREVSHTTIADARVREEWIYLDGRHALKVTDRQPESSESENVYVLNGSRTLAIRLSSTHGAEFYSLYRQMLSTLRF